ncbi:hypothetical protein ACIQM4_01105 [Streptomyces sp. NPDC091272]|uniref:hypothetical protein n=1 Tax=Streptomyces sp. NPDC091272 TaxID=3365981 RepID=UPI0037FAB4BC
MTGVLPVEELEFFLPKGDSVRFAAGFGADRRAQGRAGMLTRDASLGRGWQVVQHRLPLSARGSRSAYDALEREIAAAMTVERSYGEEEYGEIFTRLVGFNLEVAEPFVLYRQPAGGPLAGLLGTLGIQAQRNVIGQLVLAIRLLGAAGLVHRSLTPHTVRWDGARVQLTEPYCAARAGAPRDAFGAGPWASPEQRAGQGETDERDDVWSVAQLSYTLLSGRPGNGAGPPADLADYRQLAALTSSGAFASLAADRPPAASLLRLLGAPDPLAAAPKHSDPLLRARSDFDSRTAAKRQARGVAEPAYHGASGANGGSGGPNGPRAPGGPDGPHGPGGPDGFGGFNGEDQYLGFDSVNGRDQPLGYEYERPRTGRRSLRDWFATGTPRRPSAAPGAEAAAQPAPDVGAGAGPGPDLAPGQAAVPRPPLCPHCRLPVLYDEGRLFARNAKKEYKPLDLAAERRPMHRTEALRHAFQKCPHAPGNRPHYLPVPYLTHGEPLTVAMVGSSAAGKTHLLAAMLGEIEQGGLEPYGLTCLPLNPDWHREFLQEKVQRLHQGEMLDGTNQEPFADFADGLLVSGHGATRPVLFFDLAGEDLAQDNEVTRFLGEVGAFIFVLDPLRALRLASLDPVRERVGIHQRDLGDEAFTTVLNRIPRNGRYVDAAATVAVNKSDLVRFDPAVDRWLNRPQDGRFDVGRVREESRDAYAFVQHHGSRAWLKPFDDCGRCTLHFVAATGGQERDAAFPHGVRPQRVLTPLLSVFAMCGLLPGADREEVGV